MKTKEPPKAHACLISWILETGHLFDTTRSQVTGLRIFWRVEPSRLCMGSRMTLVETGVEGERKQSKERKKKTFSAWRLNYLNLKMFNL